MDFSNPLFLYALPLALAPLILHLFYHRKRSTVLFSSLIFFVRREKYFAYRRRLLELFLLLCRILALTLIILALSRPFFKKISFIAGAGTEAVIVLDDSMSMQRSVPGGRTAFELAVRQAENLMNSLNKEDSAGLIFLSGRPGVEPTREKQKVVAALRGAPVTGTAGNLAASVRKAVEVLKRSQGINREIYLVTDLQKTMLPERKIMISDLKNGRLFVLPVSGAPDNCAIGGGVVDPSLKTPGGSVYVPFSVRNLNPQERTLKVLLNITGTAVQSKNVKVKGNSTVSDHFVYVPVRAGRVDGTVSIDDPDVPLDNTLPFSFTVSDVMKVLLLSEKDDAPDPFYYLKMAVAPRPLAYGIEFVDGSFKTFGAYDLKNYPLIFIAPGSSFHADVVTKLLEYIRNGGTVVVLPETESSGRFYSAMTEFSRGALPRIFNGTDAKGGSGIIFEKGLSSLNDLLQLNLLQWRKFAVLTPDKNRVLARSGFRPVIAEYPYGTGRVIALAFDLRRRFSNWTELKSFPVVMNSFVSYAAGMKSKNIRVTCGDTLKLGGTGVTFTDSLGASGKVENGEFRKTWLPGIVLFSGGPYETVVMTPPERESDLTVIPLNGMKRVFDAPVSLLSPEEEPVFQISRLRRGTDLAGAFMLAALLLLVTEFVLGSELSRFKKQKGEE